MRKRVVSMFLALSLLIGCGAALAESAPSYDIPMRDLAARYGFKLGAPLSFWDLQNRSYLTVLSGTFNSLTATNEMKAYSLLNEAASRAAEDGMPVMNYQSADAMVAWAQENGIGVRGHVLVWDAYMSDWFFHEDYDPAKPYTDSETMRARTRYYIHEVMTHFETAFPGVVYCWDVVNEAVADGPDEYAEGDPRHLRTLRSGTVNLFREYIGDDYVPFAFKCAYETREELGADIRLYYNDYNAYFPEKAQAIRALGESVNSYALDADGADWVVYMQLQVEHLDDDDDEYVRNEADCRRADGVEGVAARRHGDETRKRRVQTHRDVRLAVFDPRQYERRAGRDGRSYRGSQEYGAELRGRGRGGAVEAVPAEPEDEYAERAEGDGVAGYGVDLRDPAFLVGNVFAYARAEDGRADERRYAADHMDRAGAGVVMEAELTEPAAAPDPVGLDGIDDEAYHGGVDAVGGKFRSLGHGAGDYRRRRGAEDEVENEIAGAGKSLRGGGYELLEAAEKVEVRLAYEAEERILAHHQRIAEQRKDDRPDAEVHEVLHDDVAGVFCPGKAGLHHGEARLHPEDERRAYQKPEFDCHFLILI